jgi:uncharacterized protein YecT (DUF1311 family)
MHASLRKIPRSLLCALLACSSALAAGPYPHIDNFGVPFSKDEDWYKQCMRVEALQAAPAALKAPADCKPVDLYDRKRNQAETSQAEWDQVRACALAKNDNAVLMMLYANGYGVPRDIDRAIHHACIVDFAAKAEMEHRIEHLAQGLEPGKPFDFCDDITSGAMGAFCAGRQETQDSRVREARLERAARSLLPASRTAFAALRRAGERYAADAGYAETDMQGTAAASFATLSQARLREEFMQAALDTIAGKLPPSSPAAYTASDRELNALYQELMSAPSKQEDQPDRIGDSTIAHAEVRQAERLWMAYRDAFVAFGASLRAGSDADAIKTLLTAQRIAQLRRVALYR